MDIIIKNLNKSFNDKKVITNFSCKIIENEFNILMGKSGCGKTTLINILIGLIQKDSGEILNFEKRSISVVFQENRLFENLSVITNLNFIIDRNIDKKIIEKDLNNLGLFGILDEQVEKLSGGMKRRISILRCILYDAEIYFMDEPFKGLDDDTKIIVSKFLKERLKNKTTLIISHDKRDISLFQGNLILM